MARRHTNKGAEQSRHCNSRRNRSSSNNHSFDSPSYLDKTKVYLRKAYDVMNDRYALVFTILLVGLLGLLLPDLSQKIHKTKELKAIKVAVDQMTKEVTQAEVACHTVADDLKYLKSLKNTMRNNEKETVSISSNVCEVEAPKDLEVLVDPANHTLPREIQQLECNHSTIVTPRGQFGMPAKPVKILMYTKNRKRDAKLKPVQVLKNKYGLFRQIFSTRNAFHKEIANMACILSTVQIYRSKKDELHQRTLLIDF